MSIFDANDYSTNFTQRGINLSSIPEFAKGLWGMISNYDPSKAVAPVKTAPSYNYVMPYEKPSYVPTTNAISQSAYYNTLPEFTMDNANAGIKLNDKTGTYYSDDPMLNYMLQVESGGNPNAKNDSALGLFQVVDNTYNGLIEKNPYLKGADRYNANDNYNLYKALTKQNIGMLKHAGIPITPLTVYGMLQQGPQFIKIYKYATGQTNKLDGINQSWMRGNMPNNIKYEENNPASWLNAWKADYDDYTNKQGRWSK